MQITEADPKGLIRESYAIEGITAGECRSIFMDWLLGLPVNCDLPPRLQLLLAHYGAGHDNHPMTQIMHTALSEAPHLPKRRGGRIGRVGSAD